MAPGLFGKIIKGIKNAATSAWNFAKNHAGDIGGLFGPAGRVIGNLIQNGFGNNNAPQPIANVGPVGQANAPNNRPNG